MMYLRGAPFTWFFHLAPARLFINGALLSIYFFVDRYYHKKEKPQTLIKDSTLIRPLKLQGTLNFIRLAGVILAIAFLNNQYFPIFASHHLYGFVREIFIVLMIVCSLIFTPKSLRVANNFSREPIKEVAYLFIGIFITMIPYLLYFQLNAQYLGIDSPVQFYYFTGLLSSFLDNTPTAVTFHSLALGLHSMSSGLIAGISPELLKAISLGSVLFGAMTYIGNGPNFMVKAIAEHYQVPMPHFFSYMISFSLIVLLPLYIIVQLLFL